MKLLCASVIFPSLALIAGIVDAASCPSGNCSMNKANSSGIRQYAAIGTKNWSKRVFDRPPKNWFVAEWNKTMKEVVSDPQTCAFDEHYPTLVTKIHWSDAYVDEKIKPTRSQARDPNWSNYIWNQKAANGDYVFDGVSDALNNELINNGRGIAKLSLLVGLTATSGNLIPPRWLRSDTSLAWLEGTNNSGKSDNWHVRFDNPAAVDHAADFLAALLAKYGKNKGLHSINLAEYFMGPNKDRPAGFNRDKYLVGVKNLWAKVVEAAPLDENGQRVNIVQTNPLFNADVTTNDLEELGIGISESDTQLHFADSITAETAAMKSLYNGGKVHVMVNGDARFACQGRRQSWDGTANPFGHKKGYSGVATPQELFWFHGSQGPVPVHSVFMTIAPWCDGPQTEANFVDAIKKFGRCGVETSKWGATPASFSSPNDDGGEASESSRPNPPTVAVN